LKNLVVDELKKLKANEGLKKFQNAAACKEKTKNKKLMSKIVLVANEGKAEVHDKFNSFVWRNSRHPLPVQLTSENKKKTKLENY